MNIKKIIKQQSKLTFDGIHKSYEDCDSYSCKQNEVRMDKPICLGYAVFEVSKLVMYETYYDKLQPHIGQEITQLHCMDIDSFVFSMITEIIIKDMENLQSMFDFSNLDKKHELFSKKNKVIGKFKIETPKNIWIDEFVCLRIQMFSFKCAIDTKNKIKGNSKSQSEHNKFEEYKKCLDGKEYQRECKK